MKIHIKAIDPETGDAEMDGYLNKAEINFLIGFAVNELMADGVRFNISMDEPDDEDAARIEYPGNFN